jgi:hypothetical protein
MRGRVFGIEMTIWGAGPLLTAVGVGLAVDSVGVQPVYLFLAILVLFLSIFVSFNKANIQLDQAQKIEAI